MNYEYEIALRDKGYKMICGIDEAGRGPFAGSVFASAVILPIDCEIDGLNDSKKLTEKKREYLFEIIKEKAIAYKIADVDCKIIDEINILQATMLAMQTACSGINADFALVDGNKLPNLEIEGMSIVKGDSLSPNIAAASILAKVSRDREMIEMDKIYPEYGFAKHKGYGTKQHIEALIKYGVTDIHRNSFLKKLRAKGLLD